MKKNKELIAIQKKLYDMALFIDEVCKKNNIEYFLAYGTCLGAIRHKDFIPWDDDFDIHMTYENYLKFVEVMKNTKSKYFLQTTDNDKEYNRLFSKVRDCETTYIEFGNEKLNMNHGLYIDIFPLVGFPDSRIMQKLYKVNRALAIYPYCNLINNKFFSGIAKFIYSFGNKNKISKFFQKQITKYSIEKCNKVISCYGERFEKNIFDQEIFSKSINKEFGKNKFPVPVKYDEYLKHCYGNYMEIPTKEQIAKMQHQVYLMDLSKSYKNYIKKG